MNDWKETGIVILILIFMFVLIVIGASVEQKIMQEHAIKHGCAMYDPYTGDFKWKK